MNLNNIRADALSDQVFAGLRDGKGIPDEIDMTLVAARTLIVGSLPPSVRKAATDILVEWAEIHGVSRPDESVG